MSRLRRAGLATSRFLWKFFGGDSPEILLTTLAVIAIAFALRHERMMAVSLLPIVAAAGLLVGVLRAGRALRRQGD